MIELVIRFCPGDLFVGRLLIKYRISEGVVCLVGKHMGRVLDNAITM